MTLFNLCAIKRNNPVRDKNDTYVVCVIIHIKAQFDAQKYVREQRYNFVLCKSILKILSVLISLAFRLEYDQVSKISKELCRFKT